MRQTRGSDTYVVRIGYLGNRPPSFQLKKWYLDCISDKGRTFIGYSAEVAWNALAFSYASYLSSGVIAKKQSKTSLIREKSPKITSEKIITWKSDRLRCSGSWHPHLSNKLSPLRLYEDETGFLSWHCLQPVSKAHIRLQDQEFDGQGYVEFLEMTILPWKLPIRELHWGRFISQNSYLVWIKWLGSHPLSLVVLNGKRIEAAQVSEREIAWDGGLLEIHDQVVLREGPLVRTALAKIPRVGSLFPKSVLDTHECKWRSRGKLVHHGKTDIGWTIHEFVQFG